MDKTVDFEIFKKQKDLHQQSLINLRFGNLKIKTENIVYWIDVHCSLLRTNKKPKKPIERF